MPTRRSETHLRVRAVSLLVAASALATAGLAPRPGAASADPATRLAAAMERATGLHIERVVFESRGSLGWGDALAGRTVLLAASARIGAPRDVWRARVRVTPQGRLLSLRGPANLTQSPLGDDGPLVVTPQGPVRVAFATRAFGQVQSAAVLDPSSPSTARIAARRGVTNLLDALSWRGVERWDVRLERPHGDVALAFEGGSLVLRAGGDTWRADPSRATVTPAAGASLVRQRDVEKPLVHWAVDTVRGLWWVGPVPIAWLEQRVFGLRDTARRYAYRWFGSRPDDGSRTVADATRVARGEPAPEGREIVTERRADDARWPPEDIAPPLARSHGRERGEGVWVDAAPPWLRRHEGAPPAFYRTWIRLDTERPYARVVLLAMDLRQLQLSMQAGVEDPVPLVGPRGDGRVPRDPAVLSRLVGAFNGAFKTEHGEYGMVVDRRVLLPPRPRAATVATLDDGRVAMGTWDAVRALPASLLSLRQNLDPLLADGVENPARRSQWGFVLGGIETMPTSRSGLCIDPHGAAFYVWGDESTGRMLGRAMRLAGCTYGMHLDMNPGHTAFHFLRVDDDAARQRQHQALAAGMRVGGERFISYSPKDFFYLTLRPLRPRGVDGPAWEPEARQPAPPWMPAVFTSRQGALTLTSATLDRVTMRLRAGRREPVARALLARFDTLVAPAGVEVLGALELGASPSRGLAVEGQTLVPFAARPGAARFELTAGGPAITVAPSTAAGDVVEGTLLVERGAPLPAGDLTSRARTALALTRDGRLITAHGVSTLADLARALVEAGAETALWVEPSDAPAHWGDGVLDAYPSSALFVLSGPAPVPVARLEPILAAARPATTAVAQPPAPR